MKKMIEEDRFEITYSDFTKLQNRVDKMGNPLILIEKNQSILWRCKECKNLKNFKEKWDIEIIQDFNDMRQEYYLEESKSIRCKKCGSYNVEEVVANSQ